MIQQLAEALRRVMRLRERGEHAEARRVAGELYDELTTVPREVAEALDAASLAGLLGGAEKLRAMAMLLWEEGRIYDAEGDASRARVRYRRARELLLEAHARGDVAPEDDASLREQARVVPTRELEPRGPSG